MAELILLLLTIVPSIFSFPFVANQPGVDSSLLKRSHNGKRTSNCPVIINRKGAAPFNSKFPYTGARNGLPGSQLGGFEVPNDDDTAHFFEAPGPNDIRGPCPGLNTAANHHFLSHDGITTFSELLDAQQNLYNIGYDLAVTLATIGVALDGDPITEKMSIGCDATSSTSATGSLLGSEAGLNGHNKFEGDSSLTRNDYFLANGDNFHFNGTLFGFMAQTAQGNFNRDHMALYMSQRYAQSLADNGNFYFGPKAVLLYGAASFLYQSFPNHGIQGDPSLEIQKSFFGAHAQADGTYTFNNAEQIPDDWFSRSAAYSLTDVATEIVALYSQYPVLFGGNVGRNNFNALTTVGNVIKNGRLSLSTTDVLCFLYQIATDNIPSSLSGVLELPLQVVQWSASKLNPIYQNYGCPLKLT